MAGGCVCDHSCHVWQSMSKHEQAGMGMRKHFKNWKANVETAWGCSQNLPWVSKRQFPESVFKMTTELLEFLKFWKLGEFPEYIGILDNFQCWTGTYILLCGTCLFTHMPPLHFEGLNLALKYVQRACIFIQFRVHWPHVVANNLTPLWTACVYNPGVATLSSIGHMNTQIWLNMFRQAYQNTCISITCNELK